MLSFTDVEIGSLKARHIVKTLATLANDVGCEEKSIALLNAASHDGSRWDLYVQDRTLLSKELRRLRRQTKHRFNAYRLPLSRKWTVFTPPGKVKDFALFLARFVDVVAMRNTRWMTCVMSCDVSANDAGRKLLGDLAYDLLDRPTVLSLSKISEKVSVPYIWAWTPRGLRSIWGELTPFEQEIITRHRYVLVEGYDDYERVEIIWDALCSRPVSEKRFAAMRPTILDAVRAHATPLVYADRDERLDEFRALADEQFGLQVHAVPRLRIDAFMPRSMEVEFLNGHYLSYRTDIASDALSEEEFHQLEGLWVVDEKTIPDDIDEWEFLCAQKCVELVADTIMSRQPKVLGPVVPALAHIVACTVLESRLPPRDIDGMREFLHQLRRKVDTSQLTSRYESVDDVVIMAARIMEPSGDTQTVTQIACRTYSALVDLPEMLPPGVMPSTVFVPQVH